MLDSNFIWSPARGQWVAKSTPSSARPTTTTSAISSNNNSPRKHHQNGSGGAHSARASSQSQLPNIRSQSHHHHGDASSSSSPSATVTPASRLHTASSAERGIFRTEGISQVGRVAQLFSDSHRVKEVSMSKATSTAINPPATSSIKKGTTSTRNVSYSYDQYNFVPVPGLNNHGIDGVACDDAERAMIGKKYVSREEVAAIELLKREQKKKDAKKSLAVKASISEIDRFSQQLRCGGDSDDSDPSPDEQTASTSNNNQRGGANKRFSTSPGGTKRGGGGGPSGGGGFKNNTDTSATNSAGNSQTTAPAIAGGVEMSGGGGVSAAAQQNPIPTESRLMELAGAYIHSLAIDCSTEELVMLYFRVVCGLDYSSAHRTTTAAVSQLLSDEIDQLHSSHHMLGVPPGSIPVTTKIGTSCSSGGFSSASDENEDTMTSTTAGGGDPCSPIMPSSPRVKGTSSSSPSSPRKPPPVTPLTGSVIVSPTARRSTAPNNNNGATPLKARSGSWARSNGKNNNRASVASAVVDEVYGDKQHSSELLGVNGGGKAPTLVVSGGGDVSPTTEKRKLPSQPPSVAASPTSAATKKVGFSNNFQFGLNGGDEPVPLHIDSNKQSFTGDTGGKKVTPPSIVKSSAAFAASPKQQINDRPTTFNDEDDVEEDPLDSADPQRQYLIAGVPNPLSSNSISLRLASAFSTQVADVVKRGGKTNTTSTSSTDGLNEDVVGPSSSVTVQRAKSISAQKDASQRLLSGKPTHNSPPHKPQADKNATTADDVTTANHNNVPAPPSSTGAPSGPPASREEFLLRGDIVELMSDSSVSGAAVLGSCYDIGNYQSTASSMPYVVPPASRRAILLSRQQRLVTSLQRTRKASHGAAWNASLPSTHMSSLIHHNNIIGNAPAVLPSYSVSGIHRPAMPLTEVIGPSEFHQLCTACILYGKEKKRRSDAAATTSSSSPPTTSSKNRQANSTTTTATPPASTIIDAVELCMVYHTLKDEIKERIHLKEQDEEQIRISIIELKELEEQRQRAFAGCGTTTTINNMGAGGAAGGFTAFPMMLDLGSLQGDGSGAFASGGGVGGNGNNHHRHQNDEVPLSSISNSSEEENGDEGEEFAILADASDDDSPFSTQQQLVPVESESGMLVVQKKRFNSPGYGGRNNKPSSTITSPTMSQGVASHGGGQRKKKVEKGTTLHSILTMQRQRKVILEEIEEIKEDLRLMEVEERAALAAVGGPVDVDLYDSAGSIAIPTQQTATQLGFERLLGIYRPPTLMGVNADEVGNNGSGSSPLGGPMSRRGSTLDNRSFGSMADLNSLMRSPSMNSLAGGGSSRNLNKLRMLSSAANGGSVTEESLSSCNVSLYSIISTLSSVSRARADTKRRVAYFVRSFMPQNGWPLSAMFLTKEDPEALLRQQRAAINSKARMSLAPGSAAALQAAAASAANNAATTNNAGDQQLPPSANANIIASISNKATQQQQQQLQRHILQLILSPSPQTQSATAQLINLLGSATGITDYNNHKMVMAALGPFLFNSTLLNEFLIPKSSASSALRGPSTIQASIAKRLNGSVMRPLKASTSSLSIGGGASPNSSSAFPRNIHNATMMMRSGGSTATSINGGAASPHHSTNGIPRPPIQPKHGGGGASSSALSPQRLHENSNHFASPAPRPPPHSPQHTPNFLLRPHFSHVTEESSTHMLSTLMMGGGQLPMDNNNHPSARSGSAGGAGSRGGLASTNNGGTLGTTTGTSSRLSVRRSTLRGGTNRRQSVSVLSPTNSAAMMSHRASISGTVPNSPSSATNNNPAFGVGLASGGGAGGGGGIGLGGAHRHQQQLERTAYFLSQCVPANIFNPHFLMYFIEEHLHPLVKVVEKISITTALPPTTPTSTSQSAFNNDTNQHHHHDNNTSASFSSTASPSTSSGGGGVYPISAAAVNAWLTLCEEYLLPLSLLVMNRYYDVFAALPDWKAPTSSSDNASKQQSKSLKSKMVESIRSYLSQKNESVRGRFERNQNNNNNSTTKPTPKSSAGVDSATTATMLELEEELLASISPELRAQFMASIDPFVILLQTSVTHVAPRNSREYNVSMIASTNKGVDEFAGILSKNSQPPHHHQSASASPRGGGGGTMSYGTTLSENHLSDDEGHPTHGGGPTTEALEIALSTVDGTTLAAAARTLLHYGNNGAGGLFGDGSLSGTNKEASAAGDLLNSDMLSNNYGGGSSGGGHHNTPHHNTSYSFHSGGNKGAGSGGNGVTNPFAPGFESSPSSGDVFGNHIKPVMIMSVEAAATMCLAVPVLRHFFENAEGW